MPLWNRRKLYVALTKLFVLGDIDHRIVHFRVCDAPEELQHTEPPGEIRSVAMSLFGKDLEEAT